MGDEFHHQAEVCGGNRYCYWNNIIPPSSSRRSSMFGTGCATSSISGDYIGWAQQQQSDDFLGDMKLSSSTTTTTITTDESACNSASDGSVVIQNIHKKQPPPPHLNLITDSSALQSMGIISNDFSSSSPPPPSSSTTTVDDDHWIINPSSLQKGTCNNGRSETTRTSNNYPTMVMIMPEEEEDHESMNYRQQESVLMENISPPIPSCPNSDHGWSNNINNFSKCGHGVSLSGSGYGSNHCFPISTSVSYGYSSPLLQTLFSDDDDPADNHPPINSLYGNNNYQLGNLNEFLPTPEFLTTTTTTTTTTTDSSFSSSSGFPNQINSTISPLQFINRNLISNNINATTPPFPSQSQTTSKIINDQKPSFLKVRAGLGKVNNNENVKGKVSSSSMMVRKSSIEEASASFKRPRIETPSPLPTFKVRKEKLGDRITALQQLVSPFGKTDTASVLHEAIEYIKFLHDQVGVLSTPYLRNSVVVVVHDQRKSCKEEGDLKSRGLCLVPISSTFPVAAENTTDFWTPTFGATFR